ncbi:MAG: AarF/ABC1/UbiB kinase family protein [Deltaproteobacteria bacterium]|nr:MAG: AarF/ABC1/UbiB kinase family protein [Deltaproteobacteria bacterium]
MIQAVQDLKRLREISAVVVRHGFGELWDRAKIWDVLGRREDTQRLSRDEIRATTARRFRETLAELGPTFIKLGQILSSRPDILPPDFIAELSHLQDRASPMPVETVFELIETGLGRSAHQLFASIDPEPMASASIAQVHRATLASGEEVVVKVQRPGIEEQIRSDTDLLFYLARFLEGVIEETGIYTPTGIVTEFRNAMLLELDFENEARNIEEFARNHADRPYVVIPKLYGDLSSRTVITLQELRGVKLKTVLESGQSAGIDRQQLARHVLEASFQQLFKDGLFHGDPHPGNIIVISLRDPDTVARLLYKVGVADQRINLHHFRQEIHDILERYLGRKLSEVDPGVLMSELVDLAMKYKIKIPKEYAVLSKASATTEGIVRQLDPELDVTQAALPYAKQLLYDRYSPASMSGGFLRVLLQLQGFLQDTPQQLAQILMDLEGGKFNVNVRSDELSRLNMNVKALGILLFTGMLASGLIVGAFSLVGRGSEGAGQTVWPLAALIGLSLAAMLFGAALSWTLLSGRVKKISLRRFFK